MVKNILHRISAVLMAFALLWIIAGSLVEFHQRYVFHKQVDLWQVVVTQSGKDLKKNLWLIDKSRNLSSGSDFHMVCQVPLVKPLTLHLSEKSTFARYLFDLITSEYNYDEALRAPPVG